MASALSKIRNRLDRIAVARSRSGLLRLVGAGSVCAEIGVWKGDFSRCILDSLHPAELHLIDPWRAMHSERYGEAWYGGRLDHGQRDMETIHHSVLDRFAVARAQGIVHVHRLPSIEAAPHFADDHFDFVYIDGDHYEESVRADLTIWSPKVRPGGIIGGDDYGVEGWWDDGVTKAVHHFVRFGSAELVMVDRTQFALRVPTL